MGRGAAAYAAWWIGLFWLWMLLVGSWDRIDLAAGAIVAAVAAAIAETARRASRVELSVPLEVVRAAASTPLTVFTDFGILVLALARSLARRRVVRGRYLARSFDPGPRTTTRGKSRRAWTVLLGGYSPNAYVIDIDPERKLVLLHDLVPSRRSERPA